MKKYFATIVSISISLLFFLSAIQPMIAHATCYSNGTDEFGTPCTYVDTTQTNTGGGSNSSNIGGGSNGSNTGGGVNTGSATLSNPAGPSNSTLGDLIHNIYTAFLTLMTGVLALYLVYCGYKFVVAQGNEKKITEAKENFYWVLIGGALILGAWTLSGIVSSTLTSLGS